MIAALALLLAFSIDRLFGELPNRLHPVAWLGSAIARGRDWALPHAWRGQFARGAVVALAAPAACALLAWTLEQVVRPWPLFAALLGGVLLKQLFAIRALGDAAFAVRDAVAAHDVTSARRLLSSLCSRKADELDEQALLAATVESVAENASDSIVAPLFYFAIAGLPGAAFYRAANTIDAMIGYHGRFEWVGKVGARLDDALNLIPARLTALLFSLVAPLARANLAAGLKGWWRDGALTESPNAGRPMATMAGLLGVRLEKPEHYVLGAGGRALDVDDVTRAWRIVSLASYAALAAIAALSLWVMNHG